MNQPRLLVAGIALFVFAVCAMAFGRDVGMPVGGVAIAAALIFAASEFKSIKFGADGFEVVPEGANRSKPAGSSYQGPAENGPQSPSASIQQNAGLLLGQLPTFLLMGTVSGTLSAMFEERAHINGMAAAVVLSLCFPFAFAVARRELNLNLLAFAAIAFGSQMAVVPVAKLALEFSSDLAMPIAAGFGAQGFILALGSALVEPRLRSIVAVATTTFVGTLSVLSSFLGEALGFDTLFGPGAFYFTWLPAQALTLAAIGIFLKPAVYAN